MRRPAITLRQLEYAILNRTCVHAVLPRPVKKPEAGGVTCRRLAIHSTVLSGKLCGA